MAPGEPHAPDKNRELWGLELAGRAPPALPMRERLTGKSTAVCPVALLLATALATAAMGDSAPMVGSLAHQPEMYRCPREQGCLSACALPGLCCSLAGRSCGSGWSSLTPVSSSVKWGSGLCPAHGEH